MSVSFLNWRERHFSRASSLIAAVAVLIVVSGLIAGLVLVRSHGPQTGGKNFTGGLEVVLQTCPAQKTSCPALVGGPVVQKDLYRRIQDGLGVSQPVVKLQGPYQIVIDLPPLKDDQALIELLVQTGEVQFLDTGSVALPVNQPISPEANYPVIRTGTDIDPSSVQATIDEQTGQPVLLFQFKADAQFLFALYTRDHIGDYLTITLDGTVIESAVIQSEITGTTQIVGSGMTLAFTKALAAILRGGPLPIPLFIKSEYRIGAAQTPLATASATLTPTPTTGPVQGGGLTSIHMVNATTGWAEGPVVKGWRVLRTTDGGSHWQDVTPLGVSWLAGEIPAYFLNTSTAWVATPQGTGSTLLFFRTTDGGQTWQQQGAFESVTPADLSFVNEQDGWALVDRQGATGNQTATLLRTTDGGATWVKVADTGIPPQKGTIPFAGSKIVTFLNATTGWLTGFSYAGTQLYVTHDAGVTWQKQTLPLPPGVSEAQFETWPPTFFNARDGVLPVQVDTPATGGADFDVYMTHDGGATWHSASLVQPPAYANSIVFADAQHGWLTDGTNLFATSDGAAHWRPLPASEAFHDVVSLNFVSNTTGWAISTPANGPLALLKTTDGGQTWNVITPTL